MGNIVRAFPGCGIVAGTAAAQALPSGLVIPPGRYLYGGEIYDCAAEKAYSFWQPGVDRTYRIVWGGDIPALMASLAWITAIGSSDATLSLDRLTANARWFKPRLLCGRTIEWARYICTSLGVETRQVHALTADPESNGFFDGHVMLEVRIAGQWVAFDIAAGLDFGGRALQDALPLAAGVLRRMSEKSVAVEQVSSSMFDPLVWQESTLANDAAREVEWRRVLQIPGILRADKTVAWCIPPGLADRSAWVRSLSPSYRVISREQWLGEFYPG